MLSCGLLKRLSLVALLALDGFQFTTLCSPVKSEFSETGTALRCSKDTSDLKPPMCLSAL